MPAINLDRLTDAQAKAHRTALGHEYKATELRLTAEGREATPEEATQQARLLKMMGEQDKNLLGQALKAWAEEKGWTNDNWHGRPGPAKAMRGSLGRGWGEAVVKASSDALGRFKDLTPSGGAPVTVPVSPTPITEGQPITALRQLLTNTPNSTGFFAFLRATERDHNAAAVEAGALKPTSKYSTERIDDTVKVIAHLSEPIDRSTLSDAPLLEQFVVDEMAIGLEFELERLILLGTGNNGEFTGVANTSGTQVQPWATDLLTTTRNAITKLEVQNLPGTGWCFNPVDWARIEMSVAPGAGYAFTAAGQALPVERAGRRLWGLPVAVSAAAPAGRGWLADWSDIALHVREEAVITWSEAMWRPNAFGTGQGASDFARNLIAFRCEARMGLAVHRPLGVVELDLTP